MITRTDHRAILRRERSATGQPRAARRPPREDFARLSLADQRFAALLMEAIREVVAGLQADASQVRRQVYRLVQGAALQERRAPQARSELARTLGPLLAEIDPVPHATVEQARRLAALRTSLLEAGAYSTAALAEAKGMTPNNARQWISRKRRAGLLFTVTHEGETLVPAFLLDEHLEPRREAQPAIEALRGAGEDGWALWAWFGLPSSWLGGVVPSELLLSRPEVVAEAARQRAAAIA
jgi:hypothetical protein